MFDEKPMIGPMNWYLAVMKSDFVHEVRLQNIVPFNLRAQLEHKTLEVQTAIAENTKLTTIMETNTECLTKQL
jgi:hypothetical protein